MNSSGIKRGLAFSAVSALAVVGLPLAAHAESVNVQVDSDDNYAITLFSFQDEDTASVKDDGVNSTVTLEAGATKDFTQLTFQYTLSAGPDNWVDIATVSRNDNGSFKHDWVVPASILDVDIDVRVIGESNQPGPNPTILTSDPDQRVNGVEILAASNGQAIGVELNDGDEIGVYQRNFTPSVPGPDPANGHFVAVNGKNSQTLGVSQTGLIDPDTGNAVAFSAPGLVIGGEFEGTVDIDGSYEYDTTSPINDEIVLAGGVDPFVGSPSLDVETYNLYKQVITTITATPDDPTVPDTQVGTDVTLKVTDQKGAPIAGAVVYRETTAADPSQADIYVGRTNGFGEVETFQARNDGEVQYFVNATNSANYDGGLGDVQTRLTVGQYVAGAVDLKGASVEGDAFDQDEYDLGDVRVQVVDSAGANFNPPASQTLTYRWVVTPFDGSAPTEVTGGPINDLPGLLGGRFNVPLPAVPAGGATFELYTALKADGSGNGSIGEKKVLTVKSGQSEVIWDGNEPQIADVNTTATATGTLQLADGTVLPGRSLGVTWVRGTGPAVGDDDTPDTFRSSPANVTTDASGRITATVRDVPDGPERSELGGELRVQSTGPDNAGVTLRNHSINFVSDVVPAGATIEIDTDTDQHTPGVPVESGLVLKDSGGTILKGRKVTVKLDRGFFLKTNEVPASVFTPGPGLSLGEVKNLVEPDPVAGNQVVWDSAGQTITIATDSTGRAEWAQVIQRDGGSGGSDKGFDDDGKVTQTATATGGSASDTEDYAWNTINGDGGVLSDALFISEISVVKTPQVDQVGPTDPAPVPNDVWFDVYAKDGYGNLVKGVTPNVAWAPGLDDHPTPVIGGSSESDFDNGGDLWVSASDGGVYDFDAVLNYGQTVFDNSLITTTTENRNVTDSFSQEWYDAVPTDYSLSVSPTGKLVPGQVALVTATVLDQEGNPVPGLQVDFVRTGDPNEIRFDTNADGQATYAFTSTSPSVESVTAVVRTPAPSSTVLKTLNAQVTFANPAPVGPVTIKPTSTTHSASGKDAVVIDGPVVAKGATVTLYKIIPATSKTTARRINMGVQKLNASGNAVFRVKDDNGNNYRGYQYVISGNSAVKRYVSAILRVR